MSSVGGRGNGRAGRTDFGELRGDTTKERGLLGLAAGSGLSRGCCRASRYLLCIVQ